MSSKRKPSIKELIEARAAESMAISKKIEEGYDFKEEYERSRKMWKSLLGDGFSAEAMERNRKRMEEEKRKSKK
ncbi:hypothetical protein [Marinobacter changyiensis]|uniref:hypothetical protein n=1 Tax=Marinobacter changyiensis TaxID=2604091 RepID=UPI0012657926|nr:hypothetical protein [Marinobacter changyiensis]